MKCLSVKAKSGHGVLLGRRKAWIVREAA